MGISSKLIFIFGALIFLSACSKKLVEGENALDKVSVSIVQGDGQFAFANSDFLEPLKIKVSGGTEDLSGIPVRFELLPGSTKATLQSDHAYTDSNGVAYITAAASYQSGTISIKASLPQANTDASSVTFNVFVQGASVAWGVTNAGGTTETAGNSFQISVKALQLDDSVDTEVNGLRYLQFSTTNPASPNGTTVILPPDGNYNLVNGVVTPNPTVTLFNSSENVSDTFTVSVTGAGITGTTTPFQVLDGPYQGVSIRDADSCAGNVVANRYSTALAPVDLYAYTTDNYGNCISSTTGNWTKTFTDPDLSFTSANNGVHQVEYTPWIVGKTGTISFDDGTYNSSTGTITVSDATPHHFAVMGLDAETNFTATAGTSHTLIVRCEDIANNPTNLYDGAHSLTWTSTATSNSPPAEIASPYAPTKPTNTSYTFSAGYISSPVPQAVFYNTLENPTFTVYENGSCAGNMCATSAAITVNTNTKSKALVRTAASNNGVAMDATSITTTADSSYNLYCATYDTYGNYIGDDATADWIVTGDIAAGDISPDLTDEATVTYNAKLIGTGTIQCDADGTLDGVGIADSTDLFTIVPGVPNYFKIDGGAGNDNAFATTAGVPFSVDIKTYDADNNFCSNYSNATFSATVSFQGSTAVFPAAPSDITLTYTSPKIDNTDTTSKSFNLSFSNGVATVSNLLLINDTENADEPVIRVVDNGASVTQADSGLVTVNQNTLFDISLRDASNNGGSRINAPTMTTDDSLTMHAAGYDLTGNYIADQNVDWTYTAPSGNCLASELAGNPVPLTATSSAIFSPDSTGSCVLTAFHAGSGASDTTGSITLNNGAIDHFKVEIQGGLTNVTAGSAFNIIVTAYDQDNNVVLDYAPDASFSLTTTSPAGPEGQTPTGFTLLPANFSSGVATVTGAKVYLSGTNFTMTATETGTGSATGTSVSISVSPNTLHHYATTNATGPFVADGASTFSIDIEARDEWGNLTTTGIGALINLSAVRLADETNTTTFGGGATNIDLAGSSTKTISGLTYLVSHQIAVVATDTNTITTPVAQRDSATFTPHINTLHHYDIDTFSTSTPTAGVAFNAKVYAKDIANNTITGIDATLTGYGSYTTASSAGSSYYANSPSHPSGTFTFTNGVSANISYTFYKKETIAKAAFTVNDGHGITGLGLTGNISVAGNALHHYANESADTNIDADGVDTLTANLFARDQYGNTVAGDASINLAVNQLDANNPGLLAGTITAIDMSSGTQTINDITYNVFGSMELVTTGGSVSMDSARSVDYTMDIVIGTLHHYDLSFTGPATAGSAFSVQVDMKDYGDNTIPGVIEAIVNARNFQWSSGLNDSPEGSSTTPNESTNFSLTFNGSGIATTNITFVKAETLAIGGLDITDDATTAITGTSEVALTINPDVADHIVFLGATTATADNTTTYNLTVESRDQFGNLNSTSNAADSNLTLKPIQTAGLTNVGPFGGSFTGIDLQNNSSQTINDLTYQVPHSIKFGFTTLPSISITDGLSTNVAWSMHQKSVASYTLEPNATSTTAGTPLNFSLKAYDGGGNLITNGDTVLETINYAFTTSADCDALYDPGSNYIANNNDPANGTISYTSGISTLAFNLYNADGSCGDAGDFSVVDNNTTGISNTAAVTTVNVSTSDHFIITSNGFAATANGLAQTATDVTIELQDLYGNPRTDSISGTLLSFAKQTGYGTNLGTLEACSPTNGDGCGGSKQALSTINLDFNASSTQTIYDLNYNVAHTIEIFATSGGVTTISADTDNLKFISVPATIASYTFTRPAATGVAGANQTWSVTAFDSVSNAMSGTENETMLEGLNFTVSDLSGGQMDGPEAGTVSFINATGLNFDSVTGSAPINLKFYNTTNDVQVNWLQLSDDTTAVTVNNDASNVMDITYAAANHFHVTTAGFAGTEISDETVYGSTTATIFLQDQYGNAAMGPAAVSVAPVYVSGFGTNTGALKAATSDGGARSDVTGLSLDFSAVDNITLYDFSYNVFQDIDIRAWQGAVDTSQANSSDISFDFDSSNVASYILDRTTASGVAGAATSWRLRAYDQAGNLMTGATNKAELDTRTFTFTDLSAGAMDGPESGVASVPGATTLTWTSATGDSQFNVTAYNKANGIAVGYIKAQDDYTTPISITNSNAMTIAGASGDHFHVTTNGFPADADGVQKTATDITITLQDIYGNNTIDALVTNATISLSRVSGYTSYGNLMVDLTDGAGSPSDITTLTPSFDVNPSITYYDASYDVGQTLEILASHANVTNDTLSADSDDITFNTVAGTVSSYTLSFDSATVVAGAATTATLTAKDGGGNTIDSDDATLNSINFSFTVQNASFDAPVTADTVAANDPTDGTLTFTSGQVTLNYKFFATGTVGTNFVRITDTTNSIGPQGNSNTIDVTPAAGGYYQFQNPAESITNTPTTVTLEVYDIYGNLHTGWETDAKLLTTGSSATTNPGTTIIDITSGVGTIDVDDTVAETVNLSIDDYLATGLTLDTEDVIFTGPPHTIVYLTQPTANETRSKTFATTPIIEVRDAAGTRVWADSSTVVTLQPFTDGGCSSAGSGTLNNASGTVSAGQLTFPTLNYNGAEQIYIGTSAGVTTEACSNATTVYETLSIDNPPGANLQQGVTYTYEITGGVPPLSSASSTYNSTGTDAGAYTGGACPVGKTCFDYTPGTTVAVTDTFYVTDSAAVTNNDSASTFVDGAILSNTGDSENFGSTALDQSNTFTISNGGNINSGTLSVVFTPTDASYWSMAPDLCNGNSLAAAGTCDITVTFLGATGNAGSPVNGAQTATLTVTGTTNGDITLNLTANRDGAIFINTGASGTYGLTALDIQQTFTIDNTGNATSGAIVTTFTPTDASYWNIDSDNCDTNSLAPAATCDIAITFLGETGNSNNPVNGAQSATLTVTGTSGGTQTINLSATRDGAIINNVGAAPTYPSTTTDDQRTFTFENTGNATTGALTTTFTPTDPSYWSVDTDNCNTNTLAVNGAQCDIQITFLGASGNTGSPVSGTYNATLTVTGGTAGSKTLNLQGTIP